MIIVRINLSKMQALNMIRCGLGDLLYRNNTFMKVALDKYGDIILVDSKDKNRIWELDDFGSYNWILVKKERNIFGRFWRKHAYKFRVTNPFSNKK